MSRVMRQKHVLKEMLEDDFELPTNTQQIVRVVNGRGNNLHEVEAADVDAENFLVTMPNKFRKNLWVKRGSYLLVEPIEEGDKVKAEICRVLSPEHVKEYTKAGVWPKRFTKKREHENIEDDEDASDNDEFMVRNLNRPTQVAQEEETDSEDDDDTEEEK